MTLILLVVAPIAIHIVLGTRLWRAHKRAELARLRALSYENALLTMMRPYVRRQQSKPRRAPEGVKPTRGAPKLAPGKRVRQRWQSDLLATEQLGSDKLTPETIRRSDAEGKLRRQDDGNLWGTSLGQGMHAPVLDLDFPHTYVPSKTEGHGHLYVHRAVSHKQLGMIVSVLNRSGLMGDGNVHQFEARGQLFAACTTDAAVKAGETPIDVS